MAKIRVYELARDLNMTNKVLLDKIKELNIEVKSHMSSLEDDTVKKIKDGLLGKKKTKKVDEKRVKPTVIRRRKKVKAETPAEEVDEKPEVSSKADEDLEKAPTEEQPPDKEKSKDSKTAAEVKKPKKKAVQKKKTEPSEEKEEQKKPPEEPKVIPLKTKKTEPVKTKKTGPVKSKKTVVSKKKKKSTAAKIISLPDPVPEVVEPDPVEEAVAPDIVTKGVAPDTKSPEKDQKLSKKELKKQKKKKKKPEAESEEVVKDKKFLKKKTSFRKKAVVEGKALYDSVKTRGRKGRKSNRNKMVAGEKTQITTPKAIKRRVKIDDTIILAELAKRMGIKANEMIQKLMGLGVMATVNQTIDFETAVLVASEFEYELEKASFVEETILGQKDIEGGKQRDRAPVVTIMGHVDHGKTSLLDVIRKTSVTDTEAGGITQHIGAYNVKTDKGQITFLDTPGHEAFTAMRSRGAKVTDIVVLVVAADDGVMPQTIEAINHSKAGEVPVIVAVNKIDKAEADPERVMRELSEHNLVSEDWGGDTIFSNVSAKQKIGINSLLDMILLQAEIMELKADPDKKAAGHVVEARLDPGRGSVATVLVQEGTLKTGDPVVCGIHYGKIRAMHNDKGQIITEAGPSVPVEVVGLTGVPSAGDELVALDDEKNAKQVSQHRSQKQRSKELAQSSKVTLEGLFDKLKEGEIKDLNLIIKADVHGSIEALKDSLVKLSGDEVKINIIHSATGAITESDVSLASVSNAIILGFNVRPSAKVTDFANEEVVDIRYYDIIYNAIRDIKDSIVGMMKSTFEEDVLGRADVREVFVIPKKGSISGSYITDGKFERGERVRLIREGIVIYDGAIKSLRRFKDDVKDVGAGFECGIGIENFNDIKVGDNLECYNLREIKPTLE